MTTRSRPPLCAVVSEACDESLRREEPGGPDVARDDVDPVRLGDHDGIALDDLRAALLRVRDGAGEQVVHQTAAPEPGADDEADDAPRVAVVDERDRP